jgi:hypothetical protein
MSGGATTASPITGSKPPTNAPKFTIETLGYDSNIFSVQANVSNVNIYRPYADSLHNRRGVIMIQNIQPPTGGLTNTSIRINYVAAVYCIERNVNRPYIRPARGIQISGNLKHALALQMMAEFLGTVYANQNMVDMGNSMYHAIDVPGEALHAFSFGGFLKNSAATIGSWVKNAYSTGKEAFQNLDPVLIEAAKLALRSKEATKLKRMAMEKIGVTDADQAKAMRVAKQAYSLARHTGIMSGSNAPLGAGGSFIDTLNDGVGLMGNVIKAGAPLLPLLMMAGSNAPLGAGTNAPLYSYGGENFGEAKFPVIKLVDGEPVYEKSFDLSVSSHRKSGSSYNRISVGGHRVYTDKRIVSLRSPSGAVMKTLEDYLASNPGTTYISLKGNDTRLIEGDSFQAALASALSGQKGRHVTGSISSFRGGKAQIGGVLGVQAKASLHPDLEVPAPNAHEANGNPVVTSI